MGQYFRLHGIGGMLIAVALLLSLVAFLGTKAVEIQKREATNYYYIKDADKIEKFNKANIEHRVLVGSK